MPCTLHRKFRVRVKLSLSHSIEPLTSLDQMESRNSLDDELNRLKAFIGSHRASTIEVEYFKILNFRCSRREHTLFIKTSVIHF